MDDPTKQDGVVYKIPCECGKVCIGETGRATQERIKEHDRDVRFVRRQNSAVSNHANAIFPFANHWYSRKVKEAIHIRLNPNNINRDSNNKADL